MNNKKRSSYILNIALICIGAICIILLILNRDNLFVDRNTITDYSVVYKDDTFKVMKKDNVLLICRSDLPRDIKISLGIASGSSVNTSDFIRDGNILTYKISGRRIIAVDSTLCLIEE